MNPLAALTPQEHRRCSDLITAQRASHGGRPVWIYALPWMETARQPALQGLWQFENWQRACLRPDKQIRYGQNAGPRFLFTDMTAFAESVRAAADRGTSDRTHFADVLNQVVTLRIHELIGCDVAVAPAYRPLWPGLAQALAASGQEPLAAALLREAASRQLAALPTPSAGEDLLVSSAERRFVAAAAALHWAVQHPSTAVARIPTADEVLHALPPNLVGAFRGSPQRLEAGSDAALMVRIIKALPSPSLAGDMARLSQQWVVEVDSAVSAGANSEFELEEDGLFL